MSDLYQLARAFPASFIKSNPSGGGSYVPHEVITQRLLEVVGPYTWEVAQVIRGDVAEIKPNPQGSSKRAKDGKPALSGAVVGVVGRLTVRVDGHQVSVEEAGDCEDPHNWPHDGARMKDACSDAIKRCAMRLGLGLHLWSGGDGTYFLEASLQKRESEQEAVTGPVPWDKGVAS